MSPLFFCSFSTERENMGLRVLKIVALKESPFPETLEVSEEIVIRLDASEKEYFLMSLGRYVLQFVDQMSAQKHVTFLFH